MSTSKPLGSIEHVVVLMLENRSFDNMLGGLYPRSSGFDGVPSDWSNPENFTDIHPPEITAWQATFGIDSMIMPYPDPQEEYTAMEEQIFSGGPMRGFVVNYQNAAPTPDGIKPIARNIMQYYAPGPDGNIPITSALAQAYAVSDRYFGSGPVQTWANRLFAHCAQPGSYVVGGRTYAYLDNASYPNYNDEDPFMGQLDFPTVFEQLDTAQGSLTSPAWKVYYDDEVPIAAILKYVHDRWTWFEGGNVFPLRADTRFETDFFTDVANGTLPTFSFLEPRYQKYSALGPVPPNSNHPGGSTTSEGPPAISICDGEKLLADIFQALVGNPELFKKTLFIVTYDEHGGLFDHVTPPPAKSPFTVPIANFPYDRYGPRVPAIFINPYIKPGTVLRPAQPGTYFDHTSIIATLREQFGLQGSLTPRDANAPTFANLIDESNPLNWGPQLPSLACPTPPGLATPEPAVYTPPARAGTIADAIYRSILARRARGNRDPRRD